jgi:hypothetical protein
MIISTVLLLALPAVVAALALRGEPWGQIARRIGPSLYLFVWPFIVWGSLKHRRWGKIPAAMLKHFRCPHCGYDLRRLPADPADGATTCPECGCSWRL